MPEITFVFGPNNTFFFDCPTTWKFHNIPGTLRQLFNVSMGPNWKIVQPYCLALGPQINSPEPIWYCGCRVADGQEKIFYSQSYFDINYPDLARWTKSIPNGARSCFVTFGTGLSYFACAPGCGSLWAGVPSELTDKVQKAFDTPSCVSLGMEQAWYVLWEDGNSAWNFYGNYGELDKTLRQAPPGSVSYLAISPYNRQHYFVAFKNRSVRYNFNGVPEWLPQMQDVFGQWQAEIMQQQAQQPYPPQPQFSPYLPPGQPAYVAAHYASPSMPAVELYSPPVQQPPVQQPSMQFAAELPAEIPANLLPPAPAPAPAPVPVPVPVPVPAPAPPPSKQPDMVAKEPDIISRLAVPEKKRSRFLTKRLSSFLGSKS